MDMNGIYQKDNKFEGEESLYYVLAGNGGSSRLSKNEKYHIITCSAVAIYDINADCVVKKIKIMTWPISNQEYEAQNENSEYFNRFKDGVIYKVLGRLQYSTFGELAFLYVKEVLEENVSGTKLDKKQEKYLAPIVLEDDVLGKLVLEKSEGLFEGTYHFLGNDITMVLCQDLVQVKMRNFSHFNPPEAQPQCVFFHTIVRIHLVTYSCNGYEFVSYCRKLPDIQKSTGMPAYNRGF